MEKILLGDVRAFIRSAVEYHREGMVPVSRDVALARAKVCAECNKNKPLLGRCGSCIKAVDWLIPTTEDLSNDHGLKNCLVCKCFLKVKVWMPFSVIDKDDRDLEFPSHCWIANRDPEVVNSDQDG